jgi:pSer/pThr/pTyr-binding forkhead associated (FHA) protein
MTSTPSQVRVFVSHSNEDNDFGRQLVGDLRKHLGDENVWYDSAGGLRTGDRWWEVIVEKLSACSAYLLVVSPAALNSEAVRAELDMAWERKLHDGLAILPVLYQHCTLRLDLRTLHYTSFLPPRAYDHALTDLLDALRVPQGLDQRTVPETVSVVEDTSIAATPVSQPAPERILPEVVPTLLMFSISGLFSPRQVSFRGSYLTIGRGADNHLILPDPSVSRQHLRLEWAATGWQILLQPSAGKTWINGRDLVNTTDLVSGDQVVIGGTVLRFELPDVPLYQGDQSSADSPTLSTQDIPPQLTVDCLECHFIVPLQSAGITVGRAPDNALIIPSPVVASHHALIQAEVVGHYIRHSIEDLESRNGLVLNGARLEPRRMYQLRSGDQLLIGPDTSGQYVTLTYTALR